MKELELGRTLKKALIGFGKYYIVELIRIKFGEPTICVFTILEKLTLFLAFTST